LSSVVAVAEAQMLQLLVPFPPQPLLPPLPLPLLQRSALPLPLLWQVVLLPQAPPLPLLLPLYWPAQDC
jgi:hypothetical protein